MKAIILAAGMGSRLGSELPKPLTILHTGETILERQLNALSTYMNKKDIMIVVGYKKKIIMKKFPDCLFVYNDLYDKTNTSKSLLCAMEKIQNEDVLWLNGDVVFDKNILKPIIEFDGSCMLVNTNSVSDEEVKYSVRKDGTISKVSKLVKNGLGEAVGINKISKSYIQKFINALDQCRDDDYFEYALELLINDNLKLFPIDISSSLCVEIDFKQDLELVNKKLSDQ